MRTWWAWPLVLALGLSPALADAREGRRDRGGRGGHQASSDRRSDRAEQRHPVPRSRGWSNRDSERGRSSGNSWGGWNRDRRWQNDGRDDRYRQDDRGSD